MEQLEEALLSLNDAKVRQCLDQEQCVQQLQGPCLILHEILALLDTGDIIKAPGRRVIIYMLRNSGLDVNTQDKKGDTALHVALKKHGDTEICEALLQTGADIYLTNKDGISALEYAMAHPKVQDRTKELIKKYRPGLWRAVQDDDLMSVRKLINLWCCVDLVKYGRSLKQAALDKGTEHIIRLVTDIAPSMSVAHSVMAGDIRAVQEVCDSAATINYDLKNLGDMGATPLFYAIMQNNSDMVELLYSKGAKIGTTITFEDEDIPLYFTALHAHIDTDIIKCLTPSHAESPTFPDMHYKGRNVMQYSVENRVGTAAIRHILLQGYPQLLSAKDRRGLCPREAAELMGNQGCVAIIDEIMHAWYLDHDSEYRKVLALKGYPYLSEALKDGVPAFEVILSMETSSEQAQFDTHLENYQDHISQLHEAVEDGDVSVVRTMLHYTSEHPNCFHTCLANSICKTNGQPLIHKAVLRQHTQIVEILGEMLIKTLKVNVDSLRDAWYRTPLHYAYAIPQAKETVYILQDLGCSDFTMDKDGRSPLVFRDQRHHPEMSKLMHHHINRDYMKLEPNPWTVRRIPLVGCRGLTGHGHSHDNTPHNHGNQQHSDRSDRNHSDQQHRNISHGNHGNDVISNEVNPRQGFLSTLLRSDSLLLTQEDHTSRTEEQGEEEREGYEEEDGYEEGAEYEEYEEDLEETGSEYSDMSNTSTDHINSCVIL